MEQDHQDDSINDRCKQKIQMVQEKFFECYHRDPKSFHPNDIEMIRTDEWWTLRFIKWNKENEEKALKQMIQAFKWRKSFGINERDANDLPIEFAKSAALFPLGTDYKGRNVIYIRVKVYRKIRVLNLFFQQFVAGIIDVVDKRSGPNGYVLVFDVAGIGWGNVDIEFLQFMIQLLQIYFPYGLRYTICHNVPKYLRPFWTMAKMFVGNHAEKTLRFSDGDEIKKYIPIESLPRYLGGECDFDFTDYEETRLCPSVRDLASKYGFTQDEVNRYYKIFEPCLLEAEKLAKFGSS
ncbi:hypothetical protein NH340_JMT01236 [Sarcoptes scabiei]|nr:hypothetical protein NH340_JMT01236 [Sarcoptes scabiei]